MGLSRSSSLFDVFRKPWVARVEMAESAVGVFRENPKTVES
jgi:hypothetical protein